MPAKEVPQSEKKVFSQRLEASTASQKLGKKSTTPSSRPLTRPRGSNQAPYMDDEQRQFFRALLLQRKIDLCADVELTVDHLRHEKNSLPDTIDRATREEEFSLELRARDRERKLLKKIDNSLSLIDLGDYGYCSKCKKQIGVARLKARPTATLCMACKEYTETLEK